MRRFKDFTINELADLRTALIVWQGMYKEPFDNGAYHDSVQDNIAQLIERSQKLIDEIRAEFFNRGGYCNE